MSENTDISSMHLSGFARAIALVAALNLLNFGVEITAALDLQSVSLFADGIDFLEDTSINIIILISLTLSVAVQRYAGYLLALLMLALAIGALFAAWQKLSSGTPPDPHLLGFVGIGALITNLVCAFILARFRRHESSLVKAAFLSARNDVLRISRSSPVQL